MLFNSAVNCSDDLVFVIAKRMSMVNWLNDTKRGKQKYQKSWPQSYFFKHKSHMDWSGIENRLTLGRPN